MKKYKAMYEAFGEQGATMRPARIVGELPHSERKSALQQAAQRLNIEKISFGVPIWKTLGLTRNAAKSDGRPWLVYTGDSLPLEYVQFNEFNDEQS